MTQFSGDPVRIMLQLQKMGHRTGPLNIKPINIGIHASNQKYLTWDSQGSDDPNDLQANMNCLDDLV